MSLVDAAPVAGPQLADLAGTVESVFATMLHVEVAAGAAAPPPGLHKIVAAVHLAGTWNGDVLVECTPVQACRFAGRFLALDPPPAVDEMVRDVLGELANMIGGNLKSALGPGVRLSIPTTAEERTYGPPAGCTRIPFGSPEGTFCVSLVAAG